MLFDAVAVPLSLVVLAFPFVFGYTEPPNPNFWPMVASWSCGALLLALYLWRTFRWEHSPGELAIPSGPMYMGPQIATGLLLAAVLGGVIGLSQYFFGDLGLSPWIQPSMPGQAIGNLRQRNQQASLVSLGVWSLLWIVAQIQARLNTPLQEALLGRTWPSWLIGLFVVWGITLLAIASAATASRTGAAQWLLIIGLLMIWRASCGRVALGLAVAGALVYGVVAWLLPGLLLEWTGFSSDGLFMRIVGDEQGCTSRKVLWANVLHLIAQKPWLGWGWGELDYAHYITLFPGTRFCVLLDNAHNLPLHLAVELGLPAAVSLCATVVVVVVRAQPWHEVDPVRQLAWGILAIVGLHSFLEFPLWYGPFQLVSVLALALLWQRPVSRWRVSPVLRAAAAIALLSTIIITGAVVWDYYRISQLYRPLSLRAAAYQNDTMSKVSSTVFFSDQVDFALLSTVSLTRESAPQIYILAKELLHFSPEPRVIEALIESAVMLGKEDEAAFHMMRFRIAYPADYDHWRIATRVRMSQVP